MVHAQINPNNDLDKVINSYQGDSLKQQASTFLLDNLSIQKSKNYRWKDTAGNPVFFNELNYEDIDEALEAFSKLKDSIKIHPETYTEFDKDVLKPKELTDNINLAFEAYHNNPWSQSYDFKTFCEYILPYRSLVEPLESDWRENYNILVSKAIETVDDTSDPVEVATAVILALKDYRFESSRPDPIPVLSPNQLLFRRSGACADLANLALLACRSVGLAATFDFTPHYGASSNRHYWNTIVDKEGNHIPFNGNAYGNRGGLPYAYHLNDRRLAKIYRKTYSIQQQSLAYYLKNEKEIPEKFLRDQNILDVTDEYVETANLSFKNVWKLNSNVAYANVFNLGRWKAVDWTKKEDTNYLFKNLGTNIVYLPSIAVKGKMVYARYPVLLNKDKPSVILKPNAQQRFDFVFNKTNCTPNLYPRDFNALDIQDGETYQLLIWDGRWRKLSQGIGNNKNVTFKNVPEKGLYYIVSSKGGSYHRIFTINPSNHQVTWY